MTEHRVKSWPHYFDLVHSGLKTFELRRNDRNYQAGDTIVLCEWIHDETPHGVASRYTGRECRRRIAYVLRPEVDANLAKPQPQWGLEAGYCILGLMDTAT
jgi:Domain of unknown function (DUF3850)